jgi:hypothetical protein
MQTQFNTAVIKARSGELQTPSVHYGGNQIDYFAYQLSNHIFALKILSKGMKMNGVKLKNIKDYYGLKGRSASDCLPQLEVIYQDYTKGL